MAERISIVTDEISQDLAECRAFLEAHDLHAVELRTIRGRRVPDLAPADLDTLRSWAGAGDPLVLAVSPGLFKCDLEDDRAIRCDLEAVLPRALELAGLLEARYVIAFAFRAAGGGSAGGTPPALAVEALRAAAQACAAAGLPLLVENEPGFLATTGAQLRALLDAVDEPNVFANWDPANSNDFEPAALARALDEIGPRLAHVHVKNGRLRPGRLHAEFCRLGEGEIDWPAHLGDLADRGYPGYLGVETHFEPVKEGSAAVVAELRQMLAAVRRGRDRP